MTHSSTTKICGFWVWINQVWSPIKSKTRRYWHISQRVSPSKSKWCKLFKGIFNSKHSKEIFLEYLKYSILSFKIFHPPPLERVVWHYQDADNDLIQRYISQFNRETFSKKDVNEQISIFNKAILNPLYNSE